MDDFAYPNTGNVLTEEILEEDCQYDEGRAAADAYIKLLRTHQDSVDELELWNILGAAQWAHSHKEWQTVFEIAAGISALLKRLGRHKGMLPANQQESNYWSMGAKLQELAVEASRRTGDQAREAEYTCNLAEFRTTQIKVLDDAESVKVLYERSLDLWTELDDPQGQADAYEGLGKLHALQDRYGEAIKRYQEALELRRTSKDRSGAMRTFIQLSEAHYELGEYPEALKCASLSVDLADDLRDAEGRAAALHQRGLAYAAQGRYQQASADLTESLRLSKEQDDRGAVAETCLALATLALRQRRYVEARGYAERAWEFFQHQGDPETQALANLRLGIALCGVKAWAEAYECLKESPGSWRKLMGRARVEHEAEAHYWLGRTLIGLGKDEEALLHLGKARKLWGDGGQQASAWDARWEIWKLRLKRRLWRGRIGAHKDSRSHEEM